MIKKCFKLILKGMVNEEIEMPFDEYKNFDELIKVYSKNTGGILISMKVNDKEIPMNYFEKVKNSFFEGGEVIELEFMPREFVMKNLVKQSSDYIEKLKSSLNNLSKDLLAHHEEGKKVVVSIIEGISALLNIIIQLKTFTSEEFFDMEDIKKIEVVIKDISQAFQDNDLEKLTEKIDYDLIVVLKILSKIFRDYEDLFNESDDIEE